MTTIGLVCAWLSVAAATQVAPEEVARRRAGDRIQVEDRISSVLGAGNSRQFRMRRCANVVFLVGERGPRNLAGNVRVVGTVRPENGQVHVDVEAVDALPSDLEQFAARARSFANDDYDGWYGLAQWARERSQLYQDQTMREKSIEAYRRGTEIERKLGEGDPERLEALRARLANQNFLRDVDFGDLDHAVLQAEARRVEDRAAGPRTLETFADRVAKTLDPDRTALPPPLDAAARERYDRSAAAEYRRSSASQRRQSARYWEVVLRQRARQMRLTAGEIDGYEAWEWATEHLSDYPEFGRQWLSEAVAADVARIEQLNRHEAERLANRIRTGLGDAGRADDVLRRWLEARERGIREVEARDAAAAGRRGERPRPKDSRARHELAMLWRAWFSDDAAANRAVQLLTESVSIDGGYEPAAAALRELNYERNAHGRWVPSGDVQRGVQAGHRAVAPGMDGDGVRRILGEPDARSRVITGPMLFEHHWCYRGAGGTVHVVLVARDGKPPVVASVHTTPAAPE